jgi:hypothetical protein
MLLIAKMFGQFSFYGPLGQSLGKLFHDYLEKKMGVKPVYTGQIPGKTRVSSLCHPMKHRTVQGNTSRTASRVRRIYRTPYFRCIFKICTGRSNAHPRNGILSDTCPLRFCQMLQGHSGPLRENRSVRPYRLSGCLPPSRPAPGIVKHQHYGGPRGGTPMP